MKYLIAWLLVLVCTAPVFAANISVQWDCNREPDMKEYRVDVSTDGGGTWEKFGTAAHPKPCTSPVSLNGVSPQIAGKQLYRVSAIDIASNPGQPSEPAIYTAPPPPPAIKPDAMSGLRAVDISTTAAMLQFDPVEGAGADIRVAISPIKWGSATSITCRIDGDCPLANLLPNTVYQAQGVRYFGVMNQGATYGPLSDVYEFTTAPFVPSTDPQPPTTSTTVKQALQDGLATCLNRKLAHTACMKALSDAIRKANP